MECVLFYFRQSPRPPVCAGLSLSSESCGLFIAFAANGESSSQAPAPPEDTPAPGQAGGPEDSARASPCPGPTGEEAPGPEAPLPSERNGGVLPDGDGDGDGAAPGAGTCNLDAAASAAGSSSASEAAKLRQPGGSVDPGRSASPESLPSGYVPGMALQG